MERLGWTLSDIENTDIETLFDYLTYIDPDTKIINGKTYKRAVEPPSWL
ncbi:MAG: hypothetical protein QM689_12745 [Oscillospiraceae bacterium]